MKSSLLYGCVALGALLWAGGAMAQETPAGAQEQTSLVDDVVVTAQRREQSLQEVPMSVTSVSQETLTQSGVVNSEALGLVTPGLTFARSSVNAQPTIRGIGTRNAGPGDEPNVATYIDGVYQAEQFNNFQEFTNIERIEVLRGPQGTLFGRNATGGAINVITRSPSFTPEAEASLTYASFNYAKAALHASGPLIGDKVAGSISAYGLTEESYYHNIFLDRSNGDSSAFWSRVKLLYVPTETLTLGLNASYSWSDNANVRNGTPINGNSAARRYVNDLVVNPTRIPLDILVPTRPWTTSTDVVPSSRVRNKQIDGHMDWDLGWANLSGLLSYSETENWVAPDDFDITPLRLSELDQFYWNTATNQELVLTSQGESRLEWIVGVTGFQGEARQNIDTISSTSGTRTVVRDRGRYQGGEGYAAFAEGTYNVSGGLFLTAGLRYSHDSKEASNGPNTTGVIARGEESWDNWAPRFVARYEFGEGSNVYASYTEGFKTGVFNPTSAAGARTPAEPETVNAYEVGLKTRLGDAVRLNLAAFRSVYTDLQTSVNVVLPSGAIATFIQNADEATINGFEGTADWYATSDLRFSLGVSILDSEIGDFPNASGVIPVFNTAGEPIGNAGTTIDVTGNELIRAPKWTVSLGTVYETQVAGGDLTLSATAFFSDRYYFDLANRVNQPAYEIVNLTATYAFANSPWSVSAFVNNATDQEYAMTFSSNVFGDAVQLAKPRWGGVTLGYRF